jgi:hypothetical protein
MSKINDRLTEEINSIIADRNIIRDTLAGEGWGQIASNTDNLNALATKISAVPTPGAISENLTRDKGTYTIPRGYHNGTGVVTWVDDDEHEALEYKLQTGVSGTPKKGEAVVIEKSDGFYGLGPVTINPIPDPYHDVSAVTATVDKVLEGKKYVDSTGVLRVGTMPDKSSYGDVVLDTINSEHTIPKGYYDGTSKVYINKQPLTVTPTESSQKLYPDDDCVIGSVDVNPIPDKYSDISDTDAIAESVLVGRTFYSEGVGFRKKGVGTMVNNGAVTKRLDGINTKSYQIAEGFHDGTGMVQFDDSVILAKLQSI